MGFPKKYAVVLLIIAGGLLLVSYGVWQFWPFGKGVQNTTTTQFASDFQAGDAARRSGDPQRAGSYFNQALQEARTLPEEGQAKLSLGVVEISTKNTPADQLKGFGLLDSVAQDERYPEISRASALINMAQWLSVKNYSTIEGALASSSYAALLPSASKDAAVSPWNSVLQTAQARRDFVDFLAIRKVFELSSIVHENYMAEYWVGAWYAARAAQLATYPQFKDDRLTLETEARKHLNNGDSVFPDNDFNYPTQIMYGDTLKAQADLRLYSLSQDAGDLSAALNALQDFSGVYAKDPYAETDKGYLVLALYFRAIALALQDQSNPADLNTTVQQFLTLGTTTLSSRISTLNYLNDAQSGMKQSFDHSSVVVLASKSPDFKNFLLGIGWKGSDFNK